MLLLNIRMRKLFPHNLLQSSYLRLLIPPAGLLRTVTEMHITPINVLVGAFWESHMALLFTLPPRLLYPPLHSDTQPLCGKRLWFSFSTTRPLSSTSSLNLLIQLIIRSIGGLNPPAPGPKELVVISRQSL